MYLFDVNVYIYAHRTDNDFHELCRETLKRIMGSRAQFGYSELALSGFVRITTNKNIFKSPNTLKQSLDFVRAIRTHDNAVAIQPGENHWDIFQNLCQETKAHGKFISDCYFAALAIESGCKWVTTDRDFARFSALESVYPSLKLS